MEVSGLSLDRLIALDALVEQGTFSATAAHLSLTQPALSHRIRNLERACGAQLLRRTNPVELTEPGKIVARHARSVLSQIGDAERELADWRAAGPTGRLDVAASSAWAFYILPPILQKLQADVPEVEINLVTIGNSRQVIEAILGGRADVAVGIIGANPGRRDIRLVPLPEDEWYLISDSDSSLKDAREISPARLRDMCVILREDGSGTKEMFERILEQESVTPDTRLQFTSTEAVKRAVEVGIGVSVIAGSTVAAEVSRGTLRIHRFAGHRLRFPYLAGVSPQKYQGAATRAFLSAIRTAPLPGPDLLPT
ncbi:MAG TPA: LysR family transcriptional regulator [Solirubrobacterales bacterium]|nr:LysR family transcriptional regulator [Solirubrobacterales bacterium]